MSFVTEEAQIKTRPKSDAENHSEANIAAVFTGGTIAVSANKTRGVVPALSGREIMERVPEIAQYLPSVRVEVHDFSTLPGPHISPEMMLTLAGFVRALKEHADGIVITHGTDSMEESAYFLDLVIGDVLPIVFTGSMHTSTDAAWDGGRNLVDALAVAAFPAFRGMGTLVVMNGEIHAASEVTKTHTMNPGTFRSLDFGPLGTVNTLALVEPRRTREPHKRQTIVLSEEAELPYVELLKTYSGMDDMLFIAALKAGAAGIVIEAMGQGNVPPGVVNGISRAREMNIPVVITTRCQAGPVRPYYAYEGAGRELEKLGCLFAPYLTGPKARIKLMVALAAGIRADDLKAIWGG
ncbi:MAG TPA: asparaginase [Candidatus Kapabacteria bacterium]|nr:asparaginase [Candidatus Kapabacteria bacterium]